MNILPRIQYSIFGERTFRRASQQSPFCHMIKIVAMERIGPGMTKVRIGARLAHWRVLMFKINFTLAHTSRLEYIDDMIYYTYVTVYYLHQKKRREVNTFINPRRIKDCF